MSLADTLFAVFAALIMFVVGFALAPLLWGAVSSTIAMALESILDIQTSVTAWQSVTPIVGVLLGGTFAAKTFKGVA